MPVKPGGKYDKDISDRRNGYANTWESGDLITTPCHKPLETYACCWCALATARGPCMSYNLRYRALYNRMDNYQCCAG